jgi:hypothetical protein
MPEGEVYLSLVVAARNDDHGGNLLGRMQAFVSGWLEQARRLEIPSELIIVEWNPPPDRPRLAEALRWGQPGPCAVRIVEVPAELHRRFAHAQALPLYQMIAKNVGIRRARGRFILATNLDILISSELAAFFAERKLEHGRLYRIDRHDAMSDVPADASIEDQLAWCRSHLLRINSREGTFAVTPDGRRALSQEDLAAPGSGIVFGRGWHAVERYTGQEPFRWAGPRAELMLEPPGPESAVLVLEVEPGPGASFAPQVEMVDERGKQIAGVHLECRSRLELPLSAPAPRQIVFETKNGGLSAGADPRVLNFRVFRADCQWGAAARGVTLRPIGMVARIKTLLGLVDHVAGRLAGGGEQVMVTVPVSGRMRSLLRRYLRLRHAAPAPPPSPDLAVPPLFLHTNGCGDFTLMAREHWFDLRAYPEFDLFSMNIDSLLCIAAHHGGAREEILTEPKRIYHIEHGTGSGWTPEGQARLYERLAANKIPHLDNDEVLRWAAQMNRLGVPMIFNHQNWGMADLQLCETRPLG